MTTRNNGHKRINPLRKLVRNFINFFPTLVLMLGLPIAIVLGTTTIYIQVQSRLCSRELDDKLTAMRVHNAELEAGTEKLKKENLKRELAYQRELKKTAKHMQKVLKKQLEKLEEEKQQWLEEQRKKDEQIKQLQEAKAKAAQISSEPQTIPGDVDAFTYSLAKIIYAEAGSDTCSDMEQQYTGYVVLNRMSSSLFAGDTIEEIFFSNGYAQTSQARYLRNECNERSIQNAKICVQNYQNGTMPVSKALVYQALFPQGVNGFKIGSTYFGYDPKIPI